MYKSAAGAGIIIAFMASLKVLMARVTMAPLMQAFSYSMNYSLGFMLIHVLHFTVATKQPAMTQLHWLLPYNSVRVRKLPRLLNWLH